MSAACILVLALVALAAVRPAAAGTGDVLVLLGEGRDRGAHKQFFEEVRAVADSLTFRVASDTDVDLFENGTRSFAAAVVLARDLNGSATPQRLIEFVDDGGGIFLATDELASPAVRGLARDLGVDLAEPGARVEDRASHAAGKTAEDHELGPETLATANVSEVPRALPRGAATVLLYRGTGLRASPRAKGRASVVVSAEETAELVRGDGQKAADASAPIGLVAIAVRPSGPGRAVVVGSLDAVGDALFSPTSVVRRGAEEDEVVGPSNHNAFRALATWALGASGTLRIAGFELLNEAVDGSTSPVLDPSALLAGERVKVVLALEELRLGIRRPTLGRRRASPPTPTWQPYLSHGVRLDVDGPEAASTRFLFELDEQGLPVGRFYVSVVVPKTPGEYAWVVRHNRDGLTPVEATYRFSVLPHPATHVEL